MALPVARHAGLFKFKDYQARACTQAHAGARGTRPTHRFLFSQKIAPGLGVSPREACDLPSARASATTFNTMGKFKENKEVPKESVARRHTARADPHEGGRATRSLSHLYYT